MKVIWDPRAKQLWVRLTEAETQKLGDEKFKIKMLNAMTKALEKEKATT